MHRSALADALFPRMRQHILNTLLQDPDRAWYLSDLARHSATTPSSLQRELASLVTAGILVRFEEGNRAYYRASVQCPIFAELRGVFAKTCGLVAHVEETLQMVRGGIRLAFLFGSVVSSDERSLSDIDLLVVGDINLTDLSTALRPLERRLLRDVNVVAYPEAEFRMKVSQGNHFLLRVLEEEKLFIIGDDHDLDDVIGVRPNQAPSDE